MFLPVKKEVLKMNSRENTLCELIRYNTLQQKIYFVLFALYNRETRHNPEKEVFITFPKLKQELNIDCKFSNKKIKDAVNAFISDNTIETETHPDGIKVIYANVEKNDVHILDIDPLMKCKSINQMKLYILLSSKNNKFFYRNAISKILGIVTETTAQKKESTKSIKALLNSLIKNNVIKSFDYDVEEKKFNIKHSNVSKIDSVEEAKEYFSESKNNMVYLDFAKANQQK